MSHCLIWVIARSPGMRSLAWVESGVLLPLRLAAALERAGHHVRECDVALVARADQPGSLDALGDLP